jgi:hypothetical protein
MNWPAPGNDPWYSANSVENTARRTYYGVNAIPCAVVDGDTFLWQDNSIENALARVTEHQGLESHVWFDMYAWASETGDSLFLRVKAVSDTVIGAGYVMQMALVEDHEHWDIPAPNRLRDFDYPFCQFGPSSRGQAFTHTGNTTDTVTYTAGFKVRDTGNEPYTLDNISFVAFVQKTTGKKVLQSGMRHFTDMNLPHGGETFRIDSVQTIRWRTTPFSGNVTVELNRDFPTGTWETILTDVPNNGEATWTVTGPNSLNARMRIYQTANTEIADTSEYRFYILGETAFAVTPDPVTRSQPAGDTTTASITINNTGAAPAQVFISANTTTEGMTVLHSTDHDGPTYEWLDMTGADDGPTGDDDGTPLDSPILLPFNFPFYGGDRTEVYMCTNGYISFQTTGFQGTTANPFNWTNQELPYAGLHAFIAVYWDDLLIAGGNSRCRVLLNPTDGLAAFTWEHAQRWNQTTVDINAQLVLYSDGRIVINYGVVHPTTDSSATIGVQNDDATFYNQAYYGRGFPRNDAIMFRESHAWAVPQLTQVIVPAAGSVEVPVFWNATAFLPDTVLTGLWTLTGNSAAPYAVTVTMSVVPNAAGDRGPLPTEFALSEAYPNPFNPTTSFTLTLGKDQDVKMVLYNIEGREVSTIMNKRVAAGTYTQAIPMENYATGVYFLKVKAGPHSAVRKLMLLK